MRHPAGWYGRGHAQVACNVEERMGTAGSVSHTGRWSLRCAAAFRRTGEECDVRGRHLDGKVPPDGCVASRRLRGVGHAVAHALPGDGPCDPAQLRQEVCHRGIQQRWHNVEHATGVV